MSKANVLRLPEYLEHILLAIARIRRYTAELKQDAVIRNFEIIGEASRNIEKYHSGFVAAHPDVPFILAYEMRNALAHGYFTVDLELVWKTIQIDLPPLEQKIRAIRQSI